MLQNIIGNYSSRAVRKIMPLVRKINELEPQCHKKTDAELRAMTDEFKERYRNGETLDSMLPEAFAVCREACLRVVGLRPYDVQVIGGIVLHQGRIAEMRTGEGKTLVATLPAYLNAITGEGVHVITVNDYLAKRDSEWMGKVYRFLGLSVGLIVHSKTSAERKAAYRADITYGTNNEFGFDYLRDNMAKSSDGEVQRGLPFAIVDEVDSILIDEARTPLIIAGQGEESTFQYQHADMFVQTLTPYIVPELDEKEFDDEIDNNYDYVVEEKRKSASLTARGIQKAEAFFQVENLANSENTPLNHYINQALKARGVMKKDIDYIVKDNEIIIVDENTGRLMFGRRFNEGLHQAIEAKESVPVQNESKTLATVTFQNFFRLYKKLSGMTGTATTERDEFKSIYQLDIVEIPTNKPVQRVDLHDLVYRTEAGKFRAIVRQVKECYLSGQPVLIGTVSIEKSEQLSRLLRREGIPHNVLNAKNHEQEAEIVAQAGKLKAVTVATNMAGRGTDILLGGNADFMALADLHRAGYNGEVISEATGYAETNDERVLEARAYYAERKAFHQESLKDEAEKVRELGGLFIIGTERHESRRVDNQLRGRSGRQGDVGTSRFFLSLEDDTLRLFGTDRLQRIMDRLEIDEDTPIDAKLLTNAIETAQKRIESRNFQSRKTVLDYDDVLNTQREVLYADRRRVLHSTDLKKEIRGMIERTIRKSIADAAGEQEHLSVDAFNQAIDRYRSMFFADADAKFSESDLATKSVTEISDMVVQQALDVYQQKEQIVEERALGLGGMRRAERLILLGNVDNLWVEHLELMEDLKQSVKLRGYAQEDPVVEFKRIGYDAFETLMRSIQDATVEQLFTFKLTYQPIA